MPGSTRPPRRLEHSVRQRIWTAMRIHRRFTIPDLMGAAEAGRSNVQNFLHALVAADYARVAIPHRSTRGCLAVYALTRDTGPFAPRIKIDGSIYDPNLNASENSR